MNPELMNHKAMRQRAMGQKVFKYFFLLSPPNPAFKVEEALLLLRLFTASPAFSMLLSCSCSVGLLPVGACQVLMGPVCSLTL